MQSFDAQKANSTSLSSGAPQANAIAISGLPH
jgi:hypothetical protein